MVLPECGRLLWNGPAVGADPMGVARVGCGSEGGASTFIFEHYEAPVGGLLETVDGQ